MFISTETEKISSWLKGNRTETTRVTAAIRYRFLSGEHELYFLGTDGMRKGVKERRI